MSRSGVQTSLVLLSLFLGTNAVGTNAPTEPQSIPLPDNTHLIDRDPATGFEIWRSSRPARASDFKRLCAAGIREMMVLDGTGDVDEKFAAKYCPGFKVIYNVEQRTRVPLSTEFLAFFDDWVAKAREQGQKIAFRCHCGCHRTGRLAAYYQMKYLGMSAEQAIVQMNHYGRVMFLFPYLRPQVRALADHLASKPCSQRGSHCVRRSRR